MQEPIFLIQSTMEKADYRKFLYIAAFKKSRFSLFNMALFCLAGSIFICWTNELKNLLAVIITWVVLFILSVAVISFKIEIKCRQRFKTDKTGCFDSVSTLNFFEDRLVIETSSFNSTYTFSYDQFYKLMESKEYFIFYVNINQAYLLRKKDIIMVSEFKDFIISKFQKRYKFIG